MEEAMRHSTDWQLPGDKSTPGDSAGGIVMGCGEEKKPAWSVFNRVLLV